MELRYTKCVLIYLALAVLIIPIRLLGIFNTAYIVIPVGMAISFLISLSYFVNSRGKGLNGFELIILFYPIFLIPLAVINDHQINYIITDTLKPMLWIGVLGFFKRIKIDEKEYLKKINLSVNFFTLCSIFTIAFVLFLLLTKGGVRASASDIAMLFPLFYYYVLKHKVWFFILFVGIFLGGKVGPLISVVLVFSLIVFLKLSLKNILKLFFFVVFIFIVLLNFDYATWKHYLPFLGKFDLLFSGNISSSDFDTLDNSFFGGRLAEVFSALVVFVDEWYLILTGPGVGYTYDLYRGGTIFDYDHHGVHFSPISLLTIYGAFYTVILYIYFFMLSIKSIYIIKRKGSKIKLLAAMFFLVSLLNSFTVFSIFSILLFPVSIGLLLNKNIYLSGKAVK